MTRKIEELIERLEKAQEPNRELDAAIAKASGLYVYEKRGGDKKEWLYPTNEDEWRKSLYETGAWRLPDYTSSIDAALTLVSEGYQWDFHSCVGEACVSNLSRDIERYGVSKISPAIALCIAALRARLP